MKAVSPNQGHTATNNRDAIGPELPHGWLDTTLGTVADYGRSIKKELKDVSLDTWILELEDVEKDTAKILQKVFVADRPFKSTKNQFKTGDVLYGKLRPYLNKVVVADTNGICTTEIVPISGEPLVDNRYIFHWLRCERFLNYVKDVSYGVNMPRLGTKDGIAAPFRLAPLAEQKIIAAKLDELLAQVDTLKTRLDAIPKILKRFRQSVLAAAVSGRLTEEWRSANNFEALSQLQSLQKRKPMGVPKHDHARFSSIPSQWEWILVRQAGTVQLGRQRAPKYHTGKKMRPYLRVANVMEGYIDTSDVMEMHFSDSDFESYRLHKGDILLNEGQSHELVGRPAIFKGEIPSACFTNTLVRFRAYEGVLREFAYFVFLNNLNVGRFQEIASRTVNISHLGAGRFADMEFPFPPVEEQTEIVRRVEQLFTYADQVEQQVKNAQARVNHLTQSILAKAFRGELTAEWRAQHPELISGENSAEALLARIKAERETTVSKTKIRKTKQPRAPRHKKANL